MLRYFIKKVNIGGDYGRKSQYIPIYYRLERRVVAYYRIYLLTEFDHIREAAEATCASDEAALEQASVVIGHYPAVEIWSGLRKVGRYTADQLQSEPSKVVYLFPPGSMATQKEG